MGAQRRNDYSKLLDCDRFHLRVNCKPPLVTQECMGVISGWATVPSFNPQPTRLDKVPLSVTNVRILQAGWFFAPKNRYSNLTVL
jgi:hypothetical protein